MPQGSVLGPTLFLIYVNDIQNSSSFFDFRLFADDTNLFHSYSQARDINLNQLSDHLDEVQRWCNTNKLTINIEKTNFIVFRGIQKKVNLTGAITLQGKDIKEADVVTFVGVSIDKYLSWSDHIEKVNKLIRMKCGILYRLRHILPLHILLLLYNTFILPHITYGLEVWGSTYPSHLKYIFTTQKMIVRMILFKSPMEHSAPLFSKLNILDVFKLHKYLVGCNIYSLSNQLSPHTLHDYFQFNTHNYGTRLGSCQNLCPFHARTNSGQFSFSFSGAKIWNDIPVDIRGSHSLSQFKHSFKKYLIDKN